MEISSIRSQPAELDASYPGSDNQNNIRAPYNQDQSEDVSLSISGKKEEPHIIYDRTGRIGVGDAKEDGKGEASDTPEASYGKSQSESETREVQKLENQDRAIRAHEHAHMAAGAGLVRGSASYEYQRGPDGKVYAAGGEVSIDTSEGATPQETVIKMQRVMSAALAPADPSPQDRHVAMQASVKAAKARVDIMKQSSQEQAEIQQLSTKKTNTQENKYTNQANLKSIGTFITLIA